MRERLQEFLDHMEMVTSKELSDNEREAVFNDFMKQIQFFQNERLIHLIVTVTFAIIAIFTTLANYVLPKYMCVCIFACNIHSSFILHKTLFLSRKKSNKSFTSTMINLSKTLIIVMM